MRACNAFQSRVTFIHEAFQTLQHLKARPLSMAYPHLYIKYPWDGKNARGALVSHADTTEAEGMIYIYVCFWIIVLSNLVSPSSNCY